MYCRDRENCRKHRKEGQRLGERATNRRQLQKEKGSPAGHWSRHMQTRSGEGEGGKVDVHGAGGA